MPRRLVHVLHLEPVRDAIDRPLHRLALRFTGLRSPSFRPDHQAPQLVPRNGNRDASFLGIGRNTFVAASRTASVVRMRLIRDPWIVRREFFAAIQAKIGHFQSPLGTAPSSGAGSAFLRLLDFRDRPAVRALAHERACELFGALCALPELHAVRQNNGRLAGQPLTPLPRARRHTATRPQPKRCPVPGCPA